MILIKNVIHNRGKHDVLIKNNRFAEIAPEIKVDNPDKVIDCQGKQAILPPFYNTHTHAAMTLFRGFADGLELFDWLNNHIWPAEAKLTSEQVYWGTKLAILEMIKSGTVFFNDSYWLQSAVIRAAEEMGVRAAVGLLFLGDSTDARVNNDEIFKNRAKYSSRIQITLTPHAIYTVSRENFIKVAEIAKAEDMFIHTHAAETRFEYEESVKNNGASPIEYLNSLGVLGSKTILAHCVHLSDEDIKIISDTQSVIAHCPVSNQKLVSGLFRYHAAAEEANCRLSIGTDGVSSNNNHSMFDEMKFASLSAKTESGLPLAGKAADIFRYATTGGAQALGIDAGVIASGKLADCMLIDLDNVQFVPNYDDNANLVYAADSSIVQTVICDGKILMENRTIPGEGEIISEFRKLMVK